MNVDVVIGDDQERDCRGFVLKTRDVDGIIDLYCMVRMYIVDSSTYISFRRYRALGLAGMSARPHNTSSWFY